VTVISIVVAGVVVVSVVGRVRMIGNVIVLVVLML